MGYKEFILGVSAVLILSGCGQKEDEKTIKVHPKVVKVFEVGSASSKSGYSYPGIVYPFKVSQMTFEVSGKIVNFNKKEGDRVKKGEVIAKLDDTLYNSNYNAAKATFEKAKVDFQRFKKLYDSKDISKSNFESIKQQFEVAKANLDIAKKNLEDTELKAEFDGIIAKKYIEDFAHITAKQKIIELQDNSKLKVKFFVPESDILKSQRDINIKKVSENFDFIVSFSVEEDKKYKAQFLEVSTQAEAITRTYETTLVMEKPKDRVVFSGMTAKIDINLKKEDTSKLLIPFHAIFSDSTKQKFVWLVKDDNSVEKQEVFTKGVYKDNIEIAEGLKKGDSVVVSGVHRLSVGDRIKVYEKLGN